jgi:hypothetical protein
MYRLEALQPRWSRTSGSDLSSHCNYLLAFAYSRIPEPRAEDPSLSSYRSTVNDHLHLVRDCKRVCSLVLRSLGFLRGTRGKSWNDWVSGIVHSSRENVVLWRVSSTTQFHCDPTSHYDTKSWMFAATRTRLTRTKSDPIGMRTHYIGLRRWAYAWDPRQSIPTRATHHLSYNMWSLKT